MNRFFALSLSVLAAAVLAGCGGNAAEEFLGTTVNVSMTPSDTFSPVDMVAPASARVVWTNNDNGPHAVNSDTNVQNFNSDLFAPQGLQNGQKFVWFIPSNATSGTKYYYHCRFHGTAGNGTALGTGMAGSITVQ
jgi:hypothetical protein